jgi:hypothetical protein
MDPHHLDHELRWATQLDRLLNQLYLDRKLRWSTQLDWLRKLHEKFPNVRVRVFKKSSHASLDESSDESDPEPNGEPLTPPPHEPSTEPSCAEDSHENEPEGKPLAEVEETLMKIYEGLYAFHNFDENMYMWKTEAKQTLSNLVVHDFIHLFYEFIVARRRSLLDSRRNIPQWSLVSIQASQEIEYIQNAVEIHVRKVLKRLATPPKKGSIIQT